MKSKLVKLFSIITVCIIVLTACKAKEPEKDLLTKVKENNKIVAGVKFDSKPFGFIDTDQQLKGFDVDLVREIAKRILGDENAVEFKQVTASSRIFALTSGSIDLIAATMTINDKRKQIIDFSIPYFESGQAVMVKKDSKINTIKDLNGKKVVVVLGSTGEKNIRLLAPEAIVQGYRTYTDAFSALQADRADAMTTDDTILAGFVLDDPNYKLLKTRYTKEFYGIGFRKSENTQSFQTAVNIALEQIKADGTLQRLTDKWMPKSY